MVFELGPVLRFETRQVARRRGTYALRVVLCLVLLAMLALYHWAFVNNLRHGITPREVRDLLSTLVTGVLGVLALIIALLIAPIAAADAFQRERLRIAAPTLLVTRLTCSRIVLETFAARLMPGLTLWLCLVPITAFAAPWCGVDPEFSFIVEIVTFGSTMVSVALALDLSLWSGRGYVALFGAYGLWGGWILFGLSRSGVPGPPSWFARTNPYMLLFSRSLGTGPVTLEDAWFFLAVAAGVTIALLSVMALTFRRIALAAPRRPRQRVRTRRVGLLGWTEHLPGPTLDGNPILWREWWRARASLGGRVFWVLFFLVAFSLTIVTARDLWHGQIGGPDLIAVVGYEIGIGLLAVAVRAASAWSAERSAGQAAVDVLLTTPLSAATIVKGKWWGAYRGVPALAALAAIGTVILAAGAPTEVVVPRWYAPPAPIAPLRVVDRLCTAGVVIGQVLVYGAAFVSLGVLLATRLARPGRAISAAVAIFVVVALVAPTLGETLFIGTRRSLAFQLGLISPLGGPIASLSSMYNASFITPSALLPSNLAWLCASGAVAWLLAWWTTHRFDRWMGRIASQ